MQTDPIADMLTRIRNAVAVRKNEVSIPHSKIKEILARLLKDTNFVDNVEVVEGATGRQILVTLSGIDTNARISTIERLSTPGLRKYSKADDIPTYKQGRGIIFVSTSHGVMTGNEAKVKRLGGELICKIS